MEISVRISVESVTSLTETRIPVSIQAEVDRQQDEDLPNRVVKEIIRH